MLSLIKDRKLIKYPACKDLLRSSDNWIEIRCDLRISEPMLLIRHRRDCTLFKQDRWDRTLINSRDQTLFKDRRDRALFNSRDSRDQTRFKPSRVLRTLPTILKTQKMSDCSNCGLLWNYFEIFLQMKNLKQVSHVSYNYLYFSFNVSILFIKYFYL